MGERRVLGCGRVLLVIMFALTIVETPRIRAQAPASEVHAKGDIAGDWQGTLQAQKALRTLVRIMKTDKGYSARWYSLDQGGQSIPVSSVSVEGVNVKLGLDLIGGEYVGTLGADGASIAGTWKQGPNPLPLTFVRATKETAWEIPAPAPPPTMMAADADPAFDVATIKPNDSGATSLQGIGFNGRNFMTRASSLMDLIAFGYGVQKKQIVGGADWMDRDRYDIAATIDTPGLPNPVQARLMIRKLITERFKLTFHNDKRELSAYVLTVTKSGSKLKETEAKGPLPGFGVRPLPTGLSMPVRNAAMEEVVTFLQTIVLDRPVVDGTGLKGRYDFVLTFTPDDSQFNGHPPKLNGSSAPAEGVEAAPSLFEAMQQQLGLKLEAQKTAVDVMVIDKVEKPSAN